VVVAGDDVVDGRVGTDGWTIVVLTVFVADGPGVVDEEVDRTGGDSEVVTNGNTTVVDIDGAALVLEVVVIGVEGSTKVEGGKNEEGAEVLLPLGGTDACGEEKVVVAAGLAQAANNELATRTAISARVTRCCVNRISSPGLKNLLSQVVKYFTEFPKNAKRVIIYTVVNSGSASIILLHLSRGRRAGFRPFVFLPLVLFNRLPQDHLYLAVNAPELARSPFV
jgi:hypothetical protein